MVCGTPFKMWRNGAIDFFHFYTNRNIYVGKFHIFGIIQDCCVLIYWYNFIQIQMRDLIFSEIFQCFLYTNCISSLRCTIHLFFHTKLSIHHLTIIVFIYKTYHWWFSDIFYDNILIMKGALRALSLVDKLKWYL